MLNFIGKCEACIDGLYPDPKMGKSCISDVALCKANQKLSSVGRCTACPSGELRDPAVPTECVAFSADKISLIEELEKTPDWANYGGEADQTKIS